MLLKMRKRLYIKEGILTQVLFVGCAICRIMIFLCNIEDENEEVLNRYGDDNNSDDTDSEIISGMQQRDLL